MNRISAIENDKKPMKILLIIAMIMAALDGILAFVFPILFPVFKSYYHCNIEQLGRIQLIFNASQVVFCIFAVWLANRFGFVKMILGALGLSALGLIIIGSAGNYNMLLAGVVILGLSETVYCGTGSAIISNYFKQNQSAIFFVFGVMLSTGSVVNSLALGRWLDYSVKDGSYWGYGVWGIAAFMLAVFALVFIVRKKIGFVDAVNFKTGFKASQAYGKLFSNRKIWGVGLALMLYSIAYIGILSWIGQLYQKKFNIDVGQASGIISLYLAGFLAGRFIFYFLTKKIKIHPMMLIFICALISTFTLVLSINAPDFQFGQVMIVVSGIFLSANVPAILSAVGDLFETGNSYPAYNFTMFVFAVSYGAGPYLIGLIGSFLSLELSIWTAPVFSLLLSVVAFANMTAGREKCCKGPNKGIVDANS